MKRAHVFLWALSLCGCSNNAAPNDASTSNDALVMNDASGDAPVDSPGDAPVDAGGGKDAASCPPMAGSATINGTFLGNALVPMDAVAIAINNTHYIAVTDYANICSFKAQELKANSNVLVFFYYQAPFPVGTRSPGNNMLSVQYAFYDAMCGSPKGESASSGTVTITKSEACVVEGTFDLMFNSDHVTGSFKAPACVMMPGSGCK